MTFENMKFKFDVGDVLNITDGNCTEKHIAVRRNGKNCKGCSLYNGGECPICRQCFDTIFTDALITAKG